MYGAQHMYILDDRDVDEYNKNPKFEPFAHLRQRIQKLIIYSDTDAVLNIDRANMWSATSWTLGLQIANCKKVLNLLYHTAGVPLTSKLYCILL